MSSKKAKNEIEHIESILDAVAESWAAATDEELMAESSEPDAFQVAEQTRSLLLQIATPYSGQASLQPAQQIDNRRPAFAEGDVVQRKNQPDVIGIIRKSRWNSQTEGWEYSVQFGARNSYPDGKHRTNWVGGAGRWTTLRRFTLRLLADVSPAAPSSSKDRLFICNGTNAVLPAPVQTVAEVSR